MRHSDREREVKRGQARLDSLRALELWNADPGLVAARLPLVGRAADRRGHHERSLTIRDLTVLEPDDRHTLLEALRPPPGFRLDFAVGTTYSLDLHALLAAPLAFALLEAQGAEEEPGRRSDSAS